MGPETVYSNTANMGKNNDAI